MDEHVRDLSDEADGVKTASEIPEIGNAGVDRPDVLAVRMSAAKPELDFRAERPIHPY